MLFLKSTSVSIAVPLCESPGLLLTNRLICLLQIPFRRILKALKLTAATWVADVFPVSIAAVIAASPAPVHRGCKLLPSLVRFILLSLFRRLLRCFRDPSPLILFMDLQIRLSRLLLQLVPLSLSLAKLL